MIVSKVNTFAYLVECCNDWTPTTKELERTILRHRTRTVDSYKLNVCLLTHLSFFYFIYLFIFLSFFFPIFDYLSLLLLTITEKLPDENFWFFLNPDWSRYMVKQCKWETVMPVLSATLSFWQFDFSYLSFNNNCPFFKINVRVVATAPEKTTHRFILILNRKSEIIWA